MYVFGTEQEDASVRAIVLRAGPKKPHFSYGLDLKAAGGRSEFVCMLVYINTHARIATHTLRNHTSATDWISKQRAAGLKESVDTYKKGLNMSQKRLNAYKKAIECV